MSKGSGGNQPVSLAGLASDIAGAAVTGRLIVAIAGCPGSGKSTLTEVLKSTLVGDHGLATQILPMDGFHYDNAVLEPAGLLSRKGSPRTFDMDGLKSILERLCQHDANDVAVPVFDRTLEISRAAGRIIRSETRVVLVEGNYLLLDDIPWGGLADSFDMTVMIGCDMGMLRDRLMQRWLHHGYSKAVAAEKVEGNDLPNAWYVMAHSRPADYVLSCDEPLGKGSRG